MIRLYETGCLFWCISEDNRVGWFLSLTKDNFEEKTVFSKTSLEFLQLGQGERFLFRGF